jgi:alkylation response protein AidB-like acyl-CoA dehydrogenase
MDISTVASRTVELSRQFASQGQPRRERRQLARADFECLVECGVHLTGLPITQGGLWRSPSLCVRDYASVYRTLARGDASVALVSTMHPTVLAFWLHGQKPPQEHSASWTAQLEHIHEAVRAGHWFGTIASEPGANGDLMATRAAAVYEDNQWLMSGDKHMGSGSGMTSYMLTVARPEDEEKPDLFLMDTRAQPWDGSTGASLVREWDGIGMQSTQSHAFRFDRISVSRYAWPGHAFTLVNKIMPFINCLFAAVTLGILDAAMAEARANMSGRATTMKSYERTCWVNAENQYWLAAQALEGMIAGVEGPDDATWSAANGKLAIAGLAESCMSAVARTVGGRAYSRSAPFAQWGEDVRALGYLRPPWPLAYDNIFNLALAEQA